MRVARVGVNMSIFFNISVDVLFYILRRHTNIYNDHNTIRLLLMYVIPSTFFCAKYVQVNSQILVIYYILRKSMNTIDIFSK